MTSAAAVQRPRLERIGPIPGLGPLAPFLAITVQLGALLVLLRLFQIEPGTGLLRILPLVFVGFVVHAALPMPWRLPFFLLLSVGAIGIVLGPVAGAVLVLFGLVLIGVCHLPVAFSARVLLLLLIAGALASIRAGWLALPPALLSSLAVPALPKIVLPVLASMFMFRLMIYLYDLRHDERARAAGTPLRGVAAQPASVWTRLSYFFLLPNVCFLLFPIVDYPTFRRTYYDAEAQTIYQRGVWLICLGLIQLLLYRLVYHYLVPSPEDVQGLGGIVRFMLAAYLIYFRVVGLFQIVVGMLCLFGFNLPPVHRFYLLASSFTDFWRRARIEWKDFMVKVFYYPALVPLQRKLGATPALIVATIWVFFITWLLHGYQWFWLIGDFRLLGNDGVFWTIIGSCVLVNSLLEARKARARAAAQWDTRRAVVHAAKVVGMFVFMCVLWSYWSSPSFGIWMSYLTAVEESGLGAYALLVGGVLAVICAGVLAQYIAFRIAATRAAAKKAALGAKSRAPSQPVSRPALAWRPAAVLAAAAVLLLVQVPNTRQALGAPMVSFVTTLSGNTLNAVDQERQDRGYYEELLDVPRSTVALAASTEGLNETPAGEASTDDEAAGGEAPSAAGNNGTEGPATAPIGASNESSAEPPPPPKPATTEAASGAAAAGVNARKEKPETTSSGGAPTSRIELAPEKPKVAVEKPKSAATDTVKAPPGGVAANAAPNTANPAGATTRKVVGRRLRSYERMTNDMTMWENTPSFVGTFRNAPVVTNRWGMRDKDYSLSPPPRTYRMALLGSSMTVGAGVPVDQTMETLLEDRLNREGPGAPRRHYEILNFSVGAYGIMQNVALLDQKVFSFKPNAVLVGIFSVDAGRMQVYLSKLIRAQLPIPYPYVQQKLREVGVDASMGDPELLRRLGPISEDLVRWSYRHIIDVCNRRGVTAIGIVLPEPTPGRGHDIDQSVRLATAAGLPLIDTRGMYDGQPVDSLRLMEQGDPHWNARGHKLVADRVYELLRENDVRALRLGFRKLNGAAAVPTPQRISPIVQRSMPEDQPARLISAPLAYGSRSSTVRPRQSIFAAVRTTPIPEPQGGPAPQVQDNLPLLEREWVRKTGDFLDFELRPSYSISYDKQFPFRTNKWGMRDKDYSLVPPPRTFRIALLGSSVELGAGVPVEQDYESVLEARLNREGPQAPKRRYEILNLSVGSYSILQNVVVAERKMLRFTPNAVILAIHSIEPRPTSRLLMSIIKSKTPIPYPYVREKLQQAGVDAGMREPELRRRLQPILDDLMRWGYQRIADIGHEHKLPVIAVVVPRSDLLPSETTSLAKQAQMAAEAGMIVLSLEGAFKPGDPVSLPPPNNHPNARGHQQLADKLYEQLRVNDARALKLGFGN